MQETKNSVAKFLFKLFYFNFLFFIVFFLRKTFAYGKISQLIIKRVYAGKKQKKFSTFCTDVLYISEVVHGMSKLKRKNLKRHLYNVHLEVS